MFKRGVQMKINKITNFTPLIMRNKAKKKLEELFNGK